MNIYDKRVAFVISDQHFIPHGGIGSFCKSFYEMGQELNWLVDVVLDKKPRNSELLKWFQNADANIFYPDNALPYSEHSNTFVFRDGFNMEKSINFRKSLMKAFEHNLYDMVVINTPEGGLGVYDLGLQDKIPVIYYTHNENIVFFDVPETGVFNNAFNEISKRLMTFDNMITGTQTTRNQQAINANYDWADVRVLPMRIPELQLLQKEDTEKEGVLFIGRFEKRKNPEFFIKTMKETGLKPKVMTNDRGKKKFEEAFKQAGITDYDIRAGIIGDEKVNFIKSARLAFHPAIQECNPFSAFETLHSCPTFALEENEWWRNFEGLIRTTNKKNAVNDLLQAYNEKFDLESQLNKMKVLHDSIANTWETVIKETEIPKGDKPTSKTSLGKALLNSETPISLHHFYFEHLGRDTLGWDDVESAYNRRSNMNIWHTKDGTFVGLTDTFDSSILQSDDGLFEF